MDMMIALKSLNEMQETASIGLTFIQHDITVKYVTYFQMYYAVISLDYGLPNDRFDSCLRRDANPKTMTSSFRVQIVFTHAASKHYKFAVNSF